MNVDDLTVRYDAGRGVWCSRVYMGTNRVTGKPWRPQKDFPDAESEEQALAMAREWFKSIDGTEGLNASMRVADLMGRYVDSGYNWAQNTVKSYGTCMKWVLPKIGGITAADITAQNIRDLYSFLRTQGSCSGKGLSQSSVKTVHEFLCGFFWWLTDNKVISENIVKCVEKPKIDSTEAQALSDAGFRKVKAELAERMSCPDTARNAVVRRTYAFAAYLALATGMRCGEVCGLTLEDTYVGDDVGEPMVRVRATVVEAKGRPPMRQERTKGKKIRNVSVGENARAVIRRHIEWQGTFLPRRIADDETRTLVCTRKGYLVRPTNVSGYFHKLADDLGLPPGTTFHTLRHTHATRMLMDGCDFRTLQEHLGHADPATTLRLYSHVVPGRDAQVAVSFDRMLGGGE